MVKYKVKISANDAFPWYMQHRMDDTKLEVWEKQRGKIIERDDVAQKDLVRAEFHAFKNGKYYIPADHVKGALINGGAMSKSKVGNSRKSMKNIVAGMFYVTTEKGREELPLSPQEFEIDKRSAVNRNIKARIITVRPKWQNWNTEFILSVDNDTITEETVKTIVENAGSYIGIGSYRPEHNGPFGRFKVDSFEKV